MKVQRLQRTPAVWRDCLNYLNIRRWNSLILLVLLAGIPRYLIGRDVPPAPIK